MFKKVLKNQKGLTLIELLAVVVILGIIAAIAIPSIGNIIQKSKIDAVKADALQVLSSAKIFVSANGVPSSGEIAKSDLQSYVDDVQLADDYKVAVSGSAFKLTATGEAGKQKVTFTSATPKNIRDNDATAVKVEDKK